MADKPLSWPRELMAVGLVALGMLLLGWGIGNGIDNVVSHAHGDGWTVSAGGTLAGLGVAAILVAVLIRRSAHWWCYVLGIAGSLLAGYSLGGGIDDLLREIDGDDYSFGIGMALFGLGSGLATAAVLLARRASPAVPR